MAYKDMFEIAISQQKGSLWDIAVLYFPILDGLWVSRDPSLYQLVLTSNRSRETATES